MPRRKKPPKDDPAQSKRFVEMAREIGVDEGEKGRQAFERVFGKLAPPKRNSSSAKKRGVTRR